MPFTPDSLESQLESDHFDFAIGGIYGTLRLANSALLTDPYLVANSALLVLDHRREELDSLEELRRLGEDLQLAVTRSDYAGIRVRRLLPNVRVVEIESPADFFGLEGVDALVTTAEGGSSWTLAHPEYSVVLLV